VTQPTRFLAVFLSAGSLGVDAAAQAPSIEHRPVHCLVADRFPVIQARITPAQQLGRARLLFRAAGTPAWYFVDMRAERGAFVGTLPKPLASTKAIEYYIESVDRSLGEARTPDQTAQVVAQRGACPANLLTAAFVTSAKLAVGTLAGGASAVPLGFSSVGILGGSVAGAAAGGAAAGSGGGGLSTGALLGIVGGAGALAAGAVVVAGGGGETWVGDANLTPADRSCTLQIALRFELSIGGSEVTGKEHEFRITSGGGQFPCPEGVGNNLVNHTVQNGRVDGSSITFAIVAASTITFTGTMSGNTIEGTLRDQPNNPGPNSGVPRTGTFRLQRQ
jgi:hypothetical protein